MLPVEGLRAFVSLFLDIGSKKKGLVVDEAL